MEYVDEKGIPQGLDIKLTQELMRRLDIPYTYCPNTWENIKDDVLERRVDLAMMVYSPYRKNMINYSQAVFKMYYQVVYRTSEDDKQFDMRHMEGKDVAYMSSRPITDTLTRAGAILHVVRDLPKALGDLSRGKYDAVICFRYQARYHIKDQNLKNLITEDLTLTPREYCYVSDNKELIEAINHQLDAMQEDGVIENIYGGYISSLDDKPLPRWIWYLVAAFLAAIFAMFFVLQLRHTRRLRREMERARQSERLKTVFLGNVSHALRTPLNAIIGFSDMLGSMDAEMLTTDDARQMLTLINKNGNQLLYFINELLQLSEIEGKDMQFQRVEANVAEIMEGYCKELAGQVPEGVELRVETPEKPTFTAYFDPNLQRVVMMHLLKNAIRHTRQGSITIYYKKENNGLYISVKDTGEGLPEQLKDNIFALLNDKNTFIQEENPGLGLSICKAIVNGAHGRIGVESKPGEGANFWHWVPVKCHS
jgi:signal transduction histidine kinase